jgi:hypothetical protein
MRAYIAFRAHSLLAMHPKVPFTFTCWLDEHLSVLHLS